MMQMLKLKKFLKIFKIMPVKKKESEILYAHKSMSTHSPHPTMVGCGDVFIPVKILNRNGESYTSSCRLRIETDLNNKTNGVNLSKISDYFLSKTFLTLENLFDDVENSFLNEFDSKNLNVRLDFSYFCTKTAPVSNKKCLYKYNCSCYLSINNNQKQYFVETNLPYASLCPTSKEISDYGAHNQRGNAYFKVEIDKFDNKKSFWVEDLIEVLDKSCSCPVYNLTNLQDEAFQTEMMYENALFIEEIAKNVVDKIQEFTKQGRIKNYSIELSQKESINTYETFVKVQSGGNL
jgi:GTP cyclohydrolase IB